MLSHRGFILRFYFRGVLLIISSAHISRKLKVKLLTLSRRRQLSMDWFLYCNGLRHERVKENFGEKLELTKEKRRRFMNKLSEYAYFYISKSITLYTCFLVFKLSKSLQQCMFKPRRRLIKVNVLK